MYGHSKCATEAQDWHKLAIDCAFASVHTCFLGGSGGWKRMPPACSMRSGTVTSTLQHVHIPDGTDNF